MIRKMKKLLCWIGEWLFIIFVLAPLMIISLWLWKKDMHESLD